MPQLQNLDLSEYPGGKLTDRGLEVLRHLPNLRTFEMTWQRGITDAGVANLRVLRSARAREPDGIADRRRRDRGAAGKARAPHFSSGRLVTDAGLPLLHNFPMLKTWHGANVCSDDEDASPTARTC